MFSTSILVYHYLQVHSWQGPYEFIGRSKCTWCLWTCVKQFPANGLRESAIVNVSLTSSTSASQDGNNLIATKHASPDISWVALGYGNVNAAEFCRILGGACVRESSPSVTSWGFVLCFSTGHWLTGLANFVNGRSVPWPSPHVFSINAASIWWLVAAYWFGASQLSWSQGCMHGSLSYPLVLENNGKDCLVPWPDSGWACFGAMFYFERFACFFHYWRNWNADMFIHFNPVSVCLGFEADGSHLTLQNQQVICLIDIWYVFFWTDMIWYLCILGPFSQQMNSGDLSQAGNLPASWWQLKQKFLGSDVVVHIPQKTLNPWRTSETVDTPGFKSCDNCDVLFSGSLHIRSY